MRIIDESATKSKFSPLMRHSQFPHTLFTIAQSLYSRAHQFDVLKSLHTESITMNRLFALVFAIGLAFSQVACATQSEPAAATNPSSNTIVDVATAAGSFNTLLAALNAADLAETLASTGPFTVLAPTDAAFSALPEGALDALLADPAQLSEVLKLHVVAGTAMAADVVKLENVSSLQGQSLAIDTRNGVRIGGASVIQTDVEASNGVIHVIDRVILPAQ